MKTIAHIRTDFPTKFGIPRQSGRVEELEATVVFEPEYRILDAFRGLEEFTHIWLIWEFSESVLETWRPTVRPPRLGGNVRKGVFATRSPFRPNPIGISSVKLEYIEIHPELGPVLHVSGADLMDGTPIYDVKPYIPEADCHVEAGGGFTARTGEHRLSVEFPQEWLELVPAQKRKALEAVLAEDPRPGYQSDAHRVYGLIFGSQNVRFCVDGEVLTVCGVENLQGQ